MGQKLPFDAVTVFDNLDSPHVTALMLDEILRMQLDPKGRFKKDFQSKAFRLQKNLMRYPDPVHCGALDWVRQHICKSPRKHMINAEDKRRHD